MTTTTKPPVPADAHTAITVGSGQKIHFGSTFGPMCGAGFNRRGGVPTVRRTSAPVDCAKCAQYAH
jgi:hypothetical protein